LLLPKSSAIRKSVNRNKHLQAKIAMRDPKKREKQSSIHVDICHKKNRSKNHSITICNFPIPN
jgi:hypothetical protein